MSPDWIVVMAAIGGIASISNTIVKCHCRVKLAQLKAYTLSDLALGSTEIKPIEPVLVLRELDSWDRDAMRTEPTNREVGGTVSPAS